MARMDNIWEFPDSHEVVMETKDTWNKFVSELEHLSNILTFFGSPAKSAFLRQMDKISDSDIKKLYARFHL